MGNGGQGERSGDRVRGQEKAPEFREGKTRLSVAHVWEKKSFSSSLMTYQLFSLKIVDHPAFTSFTSWNQRVASWLKDDPPGDR